MEEVIMCKIGGDWIIGIKVRSHDESWVKDPLIYLFDATQHGFMTFPGNPKQIQLEGAYFHYPISGIIASQYLERISIIKQPNKKLVIPN